MAKPSLQPIYQRLNGVPRYHPMTANTFADWAMEAGDMVTVTEGNKSYAAPVHTMTVKWRGKQEVVISSEGSKERSPVSKISQQKYNAGRGGGSYRGSQQLYYEMESEDGLLHATIAATAERLTTEYRETVGDVEDALTWKIEQTARSLTSTYDNKIENVQSQIRQEAARISLVVEGTGANAKIKPASIVAAINGDKSNIRLAADRISLSGNTSIADVMSVTGNSVAFRKNVWMYGQLVFADGGGTYRTLSTGVLGSMIKTAEKISSGSTLRLTRFDGSYVDFSRAVTSASWSWVNGRAKVSLQPQNQNYSSPLVDSYTKQGNPSYNASTKLVSQNVVIVDEDGNTVTTMNMSLGISSFLQTKSITSNGTYTPDTGKAGFSSVTVNVPTGPSYDNDATMTRVVAGRDSSMHTLYYGKLYYWDDDAEEYVAAYSGNAYWYRSSSNLGSGSTTVHW